MLGVTNETARRRMVQWLPGRHNDVWFLSVGAMRRLFARVARLHNGSFLRAYLQHPASELYLYYGFEEFVDARPAVRVRPVEHAIAAFYGGAAAPPPRAASHAASATLELEADDSGRTSRVAVPEATLARGERHQSHSQRAASPRRVCVQPCTARSSLNGCAVWVVWVCALVCAQASTASRSTRATSSRMGCRGCASSSTPSGTARSDRTPRGSGRRRRRARA